MAYIQLIFQRQLWVTPKQKTRQKTGSLFHWMGLFSPFPSFEKSPKDQSTYFKQPSEHRITIRNKFTLVLASSLICQGRNYQSKSCEGSAQRTQAVINKRKYSQVQCLNNEPSQHNCVVAAGTQCRMKNAHHFKKAEMSFKRLWVLSVKEK